MSETELYQKSGQILKNEGGVLEGSGTGDLMLNQNLKRQDMVVLMSRLYKEENIAKAIRENINLQILQIPFIILI